MSNEKITYGSFIGTGKTEELEEVKEIFLEELEEVPEVSVKKESKPEAPKPAQPKVVEQKKPIAPQSVNVVREQNNPQTQQEYPVEEENSEIFEWDVPLDDQFYDAKNGSKKRNSRAQRRADKKLAKKNAKKQKKLDEETERLNKISQKEEDEYLKKNKPVVKKEKKLTHPIGVKMIGIISMLVVVSLGLVTFLVSYFVTQDTRINAEDNNLTINRRSLSDCESRFNSIMNSVGMFYDLCEEESFYEDECELKARIFFERNKDIAAIAFMDLNLVFLNRQFFASHEMSQALFDSYLYAQADELDYAKNGIMVISNASPYFQTSLISIGYQITNKTSAENVLVLFSSESLIQSFSAGSISNSSLVNDKGDILVSADLDAVLSAKNIRDKYIVNEMISSHNPNEQITYTEIDGFEYIGAFSKMDTGGCAIITEVKTEIILEGINKTTRQNIWITLAVLSIAILIVWLFSRSLSVPLKTLTAVANEIKNANFNTKLFDYLDDRRGDEIGVLASSTKDERDMLNTFTKLTNKGVTKAIVLKEIDFEPHLKDITIFFSDIRGFTAISDGFNKRFGEKSAAEIIGFLNDYMSRMVNCISLTGGTVDKFEGDAIMAAWGVLRDESLDFEKLDHFSPEYKKAYTIHEKHKKEDAINAITAAIAMRYALMEYNKKAMEFTRAHEAEGDAKFKPMIRIGCGINTGRATVGFMGSNDKMEFTSIGDSVNLASRTESSNKPCGTDMLITQDTYELLKYEYIRCEANNFTIRKENLSKEIIVEMIPVSFEVKGKGIQHFYGIVNMPNFNIEEFFKKSNPDFTLDADCALAAGPNGPKTLDELRLILGIPKPDYRGVNLEEEENKVKIQTT